MDETLIARPLGQLRMINVASPEYLKRHGIPHAINDLINQKHQMVHYTRHLAPDLQDGSIPKTVDIHRFGCLA
ncbi:hypothetical protein [Winslowiella toletana]|uniref:hypothetical protein n=1 Tax=Winslowiella toletana TaxID=92490 RepID=UPI0030B80F7F